MKILPILACGVLLGTACRAPHATSQRSSPEAKAPAAMQVVPLRYAKASEVAFALQKAVSGGRVVADERTNSVIVSTKSEAELAQILTCIQQLDVEVRPAK
jgi:type II secretory pathway component GspD/PulD (secretin)